MTKTHSALAIITILALSPNLEAGKRVSKKKVCFSQAKVSPESSKSIVAHSSLIGERDPASALVYLESLIKGHSTPELWYQKGCLLEKLNQLDAAKDAYLKALDINPNYQPALIGTIDLYEKYQVQGYKNN